MLVKSCCVHTNGRCNFILLDLVTIVSLYLSLCDKGLCDHALDVQSWKNKLTKSFALNRLLIAEAFDMSRISRTHPHTYTQTKMKACFLTQGHQTVFKVPMELTLQCFGQTLLAVFAIILENCKNI